ncbi:MAG TPA: RNA 2',3'-cyclic phosphodiesterase [Streptosporangiaceae bacterium]|nr:RNA 2',3'-cyclic phosphodiesterase [Streptosporangiaceae bacterium]
MRLFVALTPPPAALDELERAVAPMRDAWPALRWASNDRWHVTLAFLGEVSDSKLGDLGARLGRAAARHDRQTLRVGRGGAFPSAGKARVVVAHIEGERAAMAGLAALAASVAAACRRAGAPAPDEGRRYKPHLTLARCRQPADVGGLVRALGGFTGQSWAVPEIHLIRSQTGPRPRYDTIGNWPLKS